jgi:hypothetical protein
MGRKIPVQEADLEHGLVAGNGELLGACAAWSKDSDRTEDGGSEENQGKSYERETQRAAATWKRKPERALQQQEISVVKARTWRQPLRSAGQNM